MGHHTEYYEAAEEERLLKLAREEKRYIEDSLNRLREFQRCSYTLGVQYEFSSIEKYYKAKLYDLRHIDVDTDPV